MLLEHLCFHLRELRLIRRVFEVQDFEFVLSANANLRFDRLESLREVQQEAVLVAALSEVGHVGPELERVRVSPQETVNRVELWLLLARRDYIE